MKQKLPHHKSKFSALITTEVRKYLCEMWKWVLHHHTLHEFFDTDLNSELCLSYNVEIALFTLLFTAWL